MLQKGGKDAVNASKKEWEAGAQEALPLYRLSVNPNEGSITPGVKALTVCFSICLRRSSRNAVLLIAAAGSTFRSKTASSLVRVNDEPSTCA